MPENTLMDLLRARTERLGSRRAYAFLSEGREVACWSYADLERKARAIAVTLREYSSVGDRVILAYPPGLEFIAAFFGCVHAGVVAVPVPLPHPRRGHDRLEAIAHHCSARILLSTHAALQANSASLAASPRFTPLMTLATDVLPDSAADAWSAPPSSGEDIALLQYTSGSTAAPKGVKVSHRNVLANLQMIQDAEANSEESRGVSWLPAYHDMGLIEGILQPLYGGYPTWLMSPADFLRQPVRWLNAISDYGGTISGAPNFAYDLCVRRVTDEEIARLDLSTWRVAYNGAEPVRADTLDAFRDRFGPCGFSTSALRPVYGLAEATALVTASPRGSDAPRVLCLREAALERGYVELASDGDGPAAALVSCGAPSNTAKLSILDPESGRVLPSGEVGEICVHGPSVTPGYWGAAETEAKRAGDDPLRTGDLGFVYEGELYVTGRIKDLIILRGRKLHPQDIEHTVENTSRVVCSSGVAAFALHTRRTDELVIVAEVEDASSVNWSEVLDAIAAAVYQRHDCAVASAVLVRRGTLPRTSSGKLMRYRCREDYLANALAELARSPSQAEGERRVA